MPLFDSLMENARNNIEKTDFTNLRLAYTESAQYTPYDSRDTKTPIYKALEASDWVAAKKAVTAALENNPLHCEWIALMASICEQLGENEQRDYYIALGRGLTNSILSSGDGRSYETAWQVIDISEEYWLMKILPFKQPISGFQQALQHHNGKSYDVLQFETADGLKIGLFFNIDLMYKSLEKRHPAPDETPSQQADDKPSKGLFGRMFGGNREN